MGGAWVRTHHSVGALGAGQHEHDAGGGGVGRCRGGLGGPGCVLLVAQLAGCRGFSWGAGLYEHRDAVIQQPFCGQQPW